MNKLFKKVATTALAATLVLPAGIAGAAAKFPDVNPNTVAPEVQQAIESLAEQGIINGFPDGTFGPNKSITRAQFAKILAQVLGLQANPSAAAQFTDVKDPEQKGWVGALYAAGLTTGTTATTYSPNKPIQRDQAATFLVRALGIEDVAKELNLTPNTIDGARINDSHKANVGLLEKIGLVKGYPNGYYGPGDAFKRQQAANLLYKVQQEGDTFVNAAKSLLNKVEVVYNDNGTLTVKGSINGAVTVDVVVREADTASTQAPGDVLFEQKGVKAENGVFEVTTNYIGNKAVTVNVVGYDEEGNVVGQVNQAAKSEQGEVQGYTEAPDLIAVRADGKYVYYTFDEEIKDEGANTDFYVVMFNGETALAKDIKVEKDKVTVRAEFHNASIPAISTFAGVKKGAVTDKDGDENVAATLPLNNVKVGGTTSGPDLKSVKIDSFKETAGDSTYTAFKVEYEFDEELDPDFDLDNHPIDPAAFQLYLKDGTKLVGKQVTKYGKEKVTVEFEVNFNNNNNTVTSIVYVNNDENQGVIGAVYNATGRYKTKIERDDVALAVVLPATVGDKATTNGDGSSKPNPLTVVEARTKVSATYLRSVDVNFKNGEITYTFSRDVENTGLTGSDLTLTLINGSTVTYDAYQKDVEIKRNKVTVTLDDVVGSSNLLASVVGAGVNEVDINSPNENGRIVPSVVAIERSFNAGEIYGPVLKKVESDYDESDELLTVTFTFSEDLADDVAEDKFFLIDAEGKEVDYEIDEIEVDDNEVVVVFEIEQEDLENVVLVVVEDGAVTSNVKYRKGRPNPAVALPF